MRADEPVHPISSDKVMDKMANGHYSGKNEYTSPFGLTVMEHYTALALQGLLANPAFTGGDPKEIAETAVRCAKAALKVADTVNFDYDDDY